VVRRAAAVAGAAAAGVLGWSVFESQWVEFRTLEVQLPSLPPELDGLTIVHLSDFHLGTISFNGRALERAVRWASEHPCDLVANTGDLHSRRSRRSSRAWASSPCSETTTSR
jgi:predicted MPP superfamily phosphohydrolase